MVLPAEEEAFPRGGADLLSPLEKRQLNARAKADAARENAEEGGAARKRPKKVRKPALVVFARRRRRRKRRAAAARPPNRRETGKTTGGSLTLSPPFHASKHLPPPQTNN